MRLGALREANVTQEGVFVVRKIVGYVPVRHPLTAMADILDGTLRDRDMLFESL